MAKPTPASLQYDMISPRRPVRSKSQKMAPRLPRCMKAETTMSPTLANTMYVKMEYTPALTGRDTLNSQRRTNGMPKIWRVKSPILLTTTLFFLSFTPMISASTWAVFTWMTPNAMAKIMKVIGSPSNCLTGSAIARLSIPKNW